MNRRGLSARWVRASLAVALLPLTSVQAAEAAPARPAAATADGSTAVRARTARHAELTKARKARLSPAAPLEFGVYPGGGAGAVNGRGEPRPEDPLLRQQALDGLRAGARPFVVHLYDAYTGPSDIAGTPAWLRTQIDGFAAAGLRVELVLRYRPSAAAGDTAGYVRFVRSRVRELGPNTSVTSLQITNEANVVGAPDAADGAYRGAAKALVAGVVAARREADRAGHGQLAIGFNWANESGPRSTAFFAQLRSIGGRRFARAVDWVGVDAYPGTWGPALPKGELGPAVRNATRTTVQTLRSRLLPRAGLGRTPIIFAESGYPTDPAGRTQARQETVMRAAVETVAQLRRRYGVAGYRWFDLRDADSAVPSFESQYGLMHDDYTPKAAFFAYRDLIARHG